MDLAKLSDGFPSEAEIHAMTELFKVLGDPTRIKMLLLFFSQESCVSEIAAKLHVTESAVSHHLQILRLNGLVKRRREGKTIFYCSMDKHLSSIMAQGWDHVIDMIK